MGNCQAAETDMLVIQHPGGRMERYYLAMTVSQVMAANPGHYVAVIVTAPLSSSSAGAKDPSAKKKGATGGDTNASVKLLKLLSPDDTLKIGHFYYLITFEDVLKVFGSKKCVKLSKLLGKQERRKKSKQEDGDRGDGGAQAAKNSSSETVEESEKNGDATMDLELGNGIGVRKCSQWKPTLQSIAEVGQ